MSEQWRQTQLGKVCEIILGQSPSSNTYNQERTGLPFFQGKSEFGGKYAQVKTWCSDPLKVAKKEDILISVRAPVGESNLAPENCCIGRGLAALRADQENLLQEFLWHQIDFKKGYLQGISQGSTFDAISGKDLSELELELPPLPEQKKIAEILSGIDTEINCLKEQTERCLRTLLTISEDVFRNCKSKFPSQDLAEVCSVITKGATPTTFGYELSGIRFPGSVTFLGGGSTNDLGEFDQNPARYCAPEAVGTLKRSELRAGDTLITIVGASIGNTCQIPEYALPANINQNVALVRSNDSVLDCDYLSLYLKTEGRKALVNIATTQAQPSVSLKQVGELQIPMPPTNEQRRISEAVTSIRNWKIQLERKMHTMAHLKQALSSDLLSGRKRVSI